MGICKKTGGAASWGGASSFYVKTLLAVVTSHWVFLHGVGTLCVALKVSHSFQVWAMASLWTGWTPPRRRWPFGRRWCWLPMNGSRDCCPCAHWQGGKSWNNPLLVPWKCPMCSLEELGNFLHQGEGDHPQAASVRVIRQLMGITLEMLMFSTNPLTEDMEDAKEDFNQEET